MRKRFRDARASFKWALGRTYWRQVFWIGERSIALLVFFFFQAEDGIRDYKVTGVQTCALPIFCGAKVEWLARAHPHADRDDVESARHAAHHRGLFSARARGDGKARQSRPRVEIGRASCRERV